MNIIKKNGIELRVEGNQIYVSTGDFYFVKDGVLQGNFMRMPVLNMDNAVAYLLRFYDKKKKAGDKL